MALTDRRFIVPTEAPDPVHDRLRSKEKSWDCLEENRFEARPGFLEGEAG